MIVIILCANLPKESPKQTILPGWISYSNLIEFIKKNKFAIINIILNIFLDKILS